MAGKFEIFGQERRILIPPQSPQRRDRRLKPGRQIKRQRREGNPRRTEPRARSDCGGRNRLAETRFLNVPSYTRAPRS
jgi:hypothetical protein